MSDGRKIVTMLGIIIGGTISGALGGSVVVGAIGGFFVSALLALGDDPPEYGPQQ